MITSGSSEDGLSWSHGRHNFKFGGRVVVPDIKTFYAGNNGQLGPHGLQRTIHQSRRLEAVAVTVAPILFLALTINSVAA